MMNEEVVISCDVRDSETTEALKQLFPDALCMQVNSITGVEIMNFIITIATLYATVNASSTIKDLLDYNKVEAKIGDVEVKGGYKHVLEILDKYMQKPSEDD